MMFRTGFSLCGIIVILIATAGCESPLSRAHEHATAFHKLSADDQRLVLRGKVRVGMDTEDVCIAWGDPDEEQTKIEGKDTTETWRYYRQITVTAPLGSFDEWSFGNSVFGMTVSGASNAGFGFGGIGNEGALLAQPHLQIADATREGSRVPRRQAGPLPPVSGRVLVAALTGRPPGGKFAVLAHRSFAAFLDVLEKAGELRRITAPVATELEITEIADREMKSPGGGKALLFEQPTIDGRPSRFPLGDQHDGFRKADGAGARHRVRGRPRAPDAAHPQGEAADESCATAGPCSNRGSISSTPGQKRVRSGPCKEVITRFDDNEAASLSLADLPVLKCWPQDGGRFITLPNVYTRDPDTGERNLGMYRMQVYDGRTTGMHWQVHKVGARHGKRYYERGERMPVAVCLGGDPAYTFAATAPLPDGLDEILFAGFARKKSVELVRCETVDLEVPADVDFVLGRLRPAGRNAPGGAVRRPHRFFTRRWTITRSST